MTSGTTSFDAGLELLAAVCPATLDALSSGIPAVQFTGRLAEATGAASASAAGIVRAGADTIGIHVKASVTTRI